MIERLYFAGKLEDEPMIVSEQPKQILTGDVKNVLANSFSWYLHSMIDELLLCESPIEQLMWIALKERERELIDYADSQTFSMAPQYEIIARNKEYRLDFFLGLSIDGRILKIDIECDGHQYHERTKKQAQRDKKRDRDLILSGFTVLRFIGSEITQDAGKCAEVVLEAAKNHAKGQAASGEDNS